MDKERKKCFGILAELNEKMAYEGLTDTDFWDYIKDYYSITSRTELNNNHGWEQLATELTSIQTTSKKFNRAMKKIWRFKYAST